MSSSRASFEQPGATAVGVVDASKVSGDVEERMFNNIFSSVDFDFRPSYS
jgi:hypothetical protein